MNSQPKAQWAGTDMTDHIHAAECQICGKALSEADVGGTYKCVHCKWYIRQQVGSGNFVWVGQ